MYPVRARFSRGAGRIPATLALVLAVLLNSSPCDGSGETFSRRTTYRISGSGWGGQRSVRLASTSVLDHSRACVPEETWADMDIDAFLEPDSVDSLVRSGLECAGMDGVGPVVWSPDKNTAKLLEGETGDPAEWRRTLEDEVLVWTGKFRPGCYGAALPVIRSRGIVGMSPRDLTELIMDSARVRLYNKMSLGRDDVRVVQTGVDTVCPDTGRRGETKVVRNRTKPPLTKKTLDFVTMMHARRMEAAEGGGYVLVSRAIGGDFDGDGDVDEDDARLVRSEIMLGINVMRPVPGFEDKCELTAVTHVNSPLTPMMVAQKLGKKGAVDFLRDVRAACGQ